ncbi:hypothetical protein V1J52_04885 [Streptomyces sp. TRM 70351]|uniref:hypothetical protein n=1 Tax=Streptomyces sp. TRM 70351 TaxID=3116552 RepID=UPI002E7BC9D8|nr:hypothetical protein [Streptomyces sp. TRM 70351]MEE1927528.1 hypothetical protein [Streptomyces sp. TRM 70351]
MTPRIRRASAILAAAATGLLAFLTAPTAQAAQAASAAPTGTAAADCRYAYCVDIWASNVNVRSCPEVSSRCQPVGFQVSREQVGAYCQALGGYVRDGQYENRYWVHILTGRGSGWVSAVYVRGGSNNSGIPGIPGPDSCP